jgi:hypothetical protein
MSIVFGDEDEMKVIREIEEKKEHSRRVQQVVTISACDPSREAFPSSPNLLGQVGRK